MATGQGEPIGRLVADVKPAPISYNKAIQSSHKELWTKVMVVEYDGLVANQTFEAVTVPEDRKVVESKWVYRWKAFCEGEVARAKQRPDLQQRVSVKHPVLTSTTPFHPVRSIPRLGLFWELLSNII